jgi:uncharacterized membrane protein SpoIIM required for sporulation
VKAQDDFVRERSADWNELEALLVRAPSMHKLPARSISRAGSLYRTVCADLMRARAADYGPEVLALLDGLAARGHNALYSAPPYRLAAVGDLLREDFPRALRRHRRAFWLALIFFLVPGITGFVGAHASRSFALSVMSPEQAEQAEEAYSDGFHSGRGEDTDTAMAGFYVYNNVGIAFRCFATGVLFGVGSAFFLIFNGLQIGAVAGLLAASGRGFNLLTFVATHGAFELTAIVIAGAAGLVMGYALVDTRGRGRFASLQAQAGDITRMVLGAAVMLLVAALIEGFWSPSSVPAPVKLSVAAALWVAVIIYLLAAGRGRRAP